MTVQAGLAHFFKIRVETTEQTAGKQAEVQ
jgi:hypothetical protein